MSEFNLTCTPLEMKLFAALAAAAAAQQAGTPVMPMMPSLPAMPAMPAMGGMNPLLMMSLLGDDSAMDSDLLMLMMMGGQGMGQMNPLMLSMLLDNEPDYDRTKLEKICDDAGVDCAAHLEAIFQPIEVRHF